MFRDFKRYLYQNLLSQVIDVAILVALKGHCHATWQVYKKPEGVFGSIEFQN